MTDAELIARLRDEHVAASRTEAADRIEALIAERDHWKDVAVREGVCMTCRGPYGATEHYGCSDCLNTGYCGEHHNTVADLEEKLAMAVEALDKIAGVNGPYSHPFPEASEGYGAFAIVTSRATLAAIKGESHE